VGLLVLDDAEERGAEIIPAGKRSFVLVRLDVTSVAGRVVPVIPLAAIWLATA
jgi:hypothetical protein